MSDTTRRWHETLIEECELKLERRLNKKEKKFITSREGFSALETIEDTVKSSEKEELERYLNSES
jgi:hypothetical protein